MLFKVSTRRRRSLGELVKEEIANRRGDSAGGRFMIMVIILGALAMIVVKALTHSPWERIPLRSPFRWRFMGITCAICVRGRIGGSVGHRSGIPDFRHCLAAGAESLTWAPYFALNMQLTWMLVGYGFVAAVLPGGG